MGIARSLLPLMLIAACPALGASIQLPPVDGPVHWLARRPDGTVAVGGGFPKPAFVGVLDTGSGRWSVPWHSKLGAGPNGPVRCGVVLPDGALLIGGDFTEISGVRAGRMARLSPDGAIDTEFARKLGDGFDGPVRALSADAGGEVWVGGEFTRLNGAAAPRFARVTASGEPVPAASPSPVSGPGEEPNEEPSLLPSPGPDASPPAVLSEPAPRPSATERGVRPRTRPKARAQPLKAEKKPEKKTEKRPKKPEKKAKP